MYAQTWRAAGAETHVFSPKLDNLLLTQLINVPNKWNIV